MEKSHNNKTSMIIRSLENYVNLALNRNVLDKKDARNKKTDTTFVKAVQGRESEPIIVNDDESALNTKFHFIQVDPTTNQPEWIITKLDGDEIYKDEYGNVHQYAMSHDDFHDHFMLRDIENNIYEKIEKVHQFLEVHANITFYYKNDIVYTKAGDFIDITNLDNLKIVKKKEFIKEYEEIDLNLIKKKQERQKQLVLDF